MTPTSVSAISSSSKSRGFRIFLLSNTGSLKSCFAGAGTLGSLKEKGQALPKFGEWDVNDSASAEGFTVIFNKARDEKMTDGKPESPGKADAQIKHSL